ncbi:shikimate kinase [Suttonella sp. R2A3]|uniref:shikimate kinase n=1 Tax=Suttonella sp. R2A3 TaxID=2908648 RepID=UPI001F1DCA98|nr:shikimate kinase [Suttonella sp. R2A3]UJF25116.1 shikimate kinase [Suttonella sp. R2A3]
MAQDRKIVLIGPMGAGKTSLGKRLANRLRWRFVDTDQAICARTGVDIPTIFDTEGEEGFRRREEQTLADVLAEPHDCVVACGGGIVLSEHNRRLIAQQRLVVFLDVSVERQLQRVGNDKRRPLTQVPDVAVRLQVLRDERLGLYEGLADYRLDTDANYFSLSFKWLWEEVQRRLEMEGV